MRTRDEKLRDFVAFHTNPGVFLCPNPWDAGSAKFLQSLGFPALATTSGGYAFSVGKRDSAAALGRDDLLKNARDIVEAVDLPISADLEDGFGVDPDTCAQTIQLSCDAGLVGGSIEDATGDAQAPIYDFRLSVDRITAAAEAAKANGFVLTARAENYLWGRPDLKDTIRRLQAFGEAGADVLYAPGLPDLNAIRTICREVDKPVNVVMGLRPPYFSVAQLQEVGVKRISVGGSFARAAFGGLQRAALEVLDQGTFTYAEEAVPGAELTALMDETQR